jgi:hypothetical protein
MLRKTSRNTFDHFAESLCMRLPFGLRHFDRDLVQNGFGSLRHAALGCEYHRDICDTLVSASRLRLLMSQSFVVLGIHGDERVRTSRIDMRCPQRVDNLPLHIAATQLALPSFWEYRGFRKVRLQ